MRLLSILPLAAAGLLFHMPGPKADFEFSGELKAPASVQFENESRRARSYEWDFGDGGTSTEENPSHTFRGAGSYVVTLRAQKRNRVDVIRRQIQIEGPTACRVRIKTDYGDMLVELYDATPEHQANFIRLARTHFYDSLLFHRVIDGFMIQGGDPKSRNAEPGQPLGMGGPGYTLPAEFVDTLAHVKGALAAARTGDNVNPEKRSSGSQFYIVDGRTVDEQMLKNMNIRKGIRYMPSLTAQYLEQGGAPFLDQEYTVFGQVIEGMEVIDKIANVKKDSRNRPEQDIPMEVEVVDYFMAKETEEQTSGSK